MTMFDDFDEAVVARLAECPCPSVIHLTDEMTTVETFHRPGCEVLERRREGSETTGEEGPK